MRLAGRLRPVGSLIGWRRSRGVTWMERVYFSWTKLEKYCQNCLERSPKKSFRFVSYGWLCPLCVALSPTCDLVPFMWLCLNTFDFVPCMWLCSNTCDFVPLVWLCHPLVTLSPTYDFVPYMWLCPNTCDFVFNIWLCPNTCDFVLNMWLCSNMCDFVSYLWLCPICVTASPEAAY